MRLELSSPTSRSPFCTSSMVLKRSAMFLKRADEEACARVLLGWPSWLDHQKAIKKSYIKLYRSSLDSQQPIVWIFEFFSRAPICFTVNTVMRGLLCVYKPRGYSSFSVVSKIRHSLGLFPDSNLTHRARKESQSRSWWHSWSWSRRIITDWCGKGLLLAAFNRISWQKGKTTCAF